MERAFVLAVLAGTVALAVGRPRLRLGTGSVRFTPGTAALLGVALLLAGGALGPADLVEAGRIQWRALIALTAIMLMTGVVQEAGAFDRLSARIETAARGRSAARTFTLVFAVSFATPSLLNNDAAILILTPLVVALARRLYPGRPDVTIAFAFAVFLAPGVAPFVVSNPMNMIVAEVAGLGFNAYAAVMAPIALAGAAVTYAILRIVYRGVLRSAVPARGPVTTVHASPGERPVVALLLAVFAAYPIAAACGAEIWFVATGGALGALALARVYQIAPLRRTARHVSLDILGFLWGIFVIVQALRRAGAADALAAAYAAAPADSGAHLALVGAISAGGSAIVDNHPMALLNLMALDGACDARPLLAALVGGDIGPRLLPIGSLAGLLWLDLLRRAGVEIGLARFVRLGTLALLPTLACSLLLLWLS